MEINEFGLSKELAVELIVFFCKERLKNILGIDDNSFISIVRIKDKEAINSLALCSEMIEKASDIAEGDWSNIKSIEHQDVKISYEVLPALTNPLFNLSGNLKYAELLWKIDELDKYKWIDEATKVLKKDTSIGDVVVDVLTDSYNSFKKRVVGFKEKVKEIS